MSLTNSDRFQNLDFAGFKELAKDKSLSPHEKIGFPDSYREGKENLILDDINVKLPNLNKENQIIVDIGAGCGTLVNSLISQCTKNNSVLILIDSEEMLTQLPD